MMIHELQRYERFTVPGLPHVPVMTFDHMDGMFGHASTDDGQLYYIIAGAECVVEGRDDG